MASSLMPAVTQYANITQLLELSQEVAALKAQLAAGESVADHVWLMRSAFSVLNMQAGFGMLEAGLVRNRNTANIMLKNLIDVAFGGLAWWFCGWALAYGRPSDGGEANGFIGVHEWFGTTTTDNNWAMWVFQFAFAATAVTIVSGCMAERAKFMSYCVFSFVCTALLYPPVAHWVWDSDGWLFRRGVIDFAGCGPVHMVGGWAGAIGAWMLRPRLGRFGYTGSTSKGDDDDDDDDDLVQDDGGVTPLHDNKKNKKKKHTRSSSDDDDDYLDDDSWVDISSSSEADDGGGYSDTSATAPPVAPRPQSGISSLEADGISMYKGSQVPTQSSSHSSHVLEEEELEAMDDNFPMSSPTFAILGLFALWWGWYSFNAGSTASVNDGAAVTAALVAVNTTLAASAGTTIGFLYSLAIDRDFIDIRSCVNGCLAGLVGITSACAVVEPWAAVAIGCIAALFVLFAVPMVDKAKIDDPVGAIAVHGFGGSFGLLVPGIFATKENGGLIYTGDFTQLGTQCIAIVAILAWSVGTAFLVFTLLRVTLGLRVTAAQERCGLDSAEHNIVNMYHLHELISGVEEDEIRLGDVIEQRGGRLTHRPPGAGDVSDFEAMFYGDVGRHSQRSSRVVGPHRRESSVSSLASMGGGAIDSMEPRPPMGEMGGMGPSVGQAHRYSTNYVVLPRKLKGRKAAIEAKRRMTEARVKVDRERRRLARKLRRKHGVTARSSGIASVRLHRLAAMQQDIANRMERPFAHGTAAIPPPPPPAAAAAAHGTSGGITGAPTHALTGKTQEKYEVHDISEAGSDFGDDVLLNTAQLPGALNKSDVEA